jgi:hypothetical protein
MRNEQNDLITRIGPATSAAKLKRMQWQAAAPVDEAR